MDDQKPGHFKIYFWTVIWGVVALFLTAASMGPLLVPILALGLFIWLIAGLSKLKEQERRKPFLIKFAFWAVVLAIIFGYQSWRANSARRDADAVVALVVQYKAAHGRYPNSLKQLTVADPRIISNPHIQYKPADGAAPFMYYASTSTLFTDYIYDFDTASWRRDADDTF